MLGKDALKRKFGHIGTLAFRKASVYPILLGLTACLVLSAILWFEVLSRIEAEKSALHQRSLNDAAALAHAYAQYAANTIEQMDRLTLRVKYEWQRSTGNPDLAGFSESGMFRGFQQVLISIINRKGLPVTQARADPQYAPIDLADRDFFRFHREDRSDVLLMGKPVVDGMTGKSVIEFTRRLETADGSFDGVVIVSVPRDYLTSFYAGMNPGNTGLLALVGSDGSLRAARVGDTPQEPPPAAFRTVPLFATPEGSTLLEGQKWFADRQARYVGWESLKAYPLVVIAGIAEHDLFAPHRRTWALYRQQAAAGSVLLFLLALVGIGWSARLAWRQQYAEEVRMAYRIATEASREGFYMLHALRDQTGAVVDFEVVDCNERGAEFYGRDKAQVLGMKLSTIYPTPLFDGLMDTFRNAMESGFYEYEREVPPNSPMTIGWVRTKLVRAGTGLAVTIEDVTERKRAEARQRLAASVFDNALDGILITDEKLMIVAVNRAFTDITGYPAAETLGNSPRMLRSEDHDAAFYAAMRRAIHETGSWQGEIWDKRKDGTRYCALLAISAVRDEQGEITNYCAVFADVTESKVAEAKLVRLNAELEDRVTARTRELERANRELEAFSYSVSHDLRSPLRAINGFSAVVIEENEGKLDPASVDHLRKIAAAAHRMGELIDDLLQLAKVSRQAMRRVAFDLSDISAKVIRRLAEAHPLRKVSVVIAPGMTAEGDPSLMTIALENLLGNAWKFTSNAERAGIEIGTMERDGELIYFVRDNGAGFDMKHAPSLFGAFQRLHSSEDFEGTGIGLSIVQRIVARHEGRIWAEAEVGRGATFYFTLWNARPPTK